MFTLYSMIVSQEPVNVDTRKQVHNTSHRYTLQWNLYTSRNGSILVISKWDHVERGTNMCYNIHTSSGVKFIYISTFSFSSKGHAFRFEKHAVERVQYMVQYIQITKTKESLSSHTKITHVLHNCCKYKTVSSGRIYTVQWMGYKGGLW